jgi:tetratricopeptide (TPR) repeat protein/predicted Ser/Thr protein kinase
MSADDEVTHAEGAAPSEREPGDEILGASLDRYTVLQKIGRGGMGVVYAAYDRKLDRKVALKVLRSASDHYRQRLVREAQAMARLSHPNVVAVFDTGTVDGRLFLAMEFVQGLTLGAWQRAPGRAWREILRAYVDAGRGLAAAHDAGLVHRDFKPENVLVSESGHVKVTDFGVARAVGDAATTASAEEDGEIASEPDVAGSPRPSLDAPMTEDGALLGTPGYMAPEQYTCEGADARSDQFSFCVSLYEALYGAKPFAGRTFSAMVDATLAGRVSEPPGATGVPPRVRRVLLRGLRPDPAERYPSMTAVLDDLARDPWRRTRRAIAAAGAVAAVAGASVAVGRATAARQAQLCAGGDAEVTDVWGPDVQRQVGDALLATGAPFAEDTWRRTRAEIDRVMSRWAETYRQTCEATRIRQVQAESVMTVRMACLEQRRDEARALVQVLEHADREVAGKALRAAMALPSADQCKDVVTLTLLEPEPSAPGAAEEITAVRRELATVRANVEAGRPAIARDAAAPLVERARRVGHHPLLAEALLWSARAKADAGGARDASIADGIEAAFAADRGRADRTRAEAATRLVFWTTQAGRYDDAERWSQVAEAVLDRTGDDGLGRAEWLYARASLMDSLGRVRETADAARLAVEAAKRGGADAPRIAELEAVYAQELAAVGQGAEAERLIAEANDAIVRTMGEEHPMRMRFLGAAAYVASTTNDHKRAFDYEVQGIALAERLSPEGADIADYYANACWELTCLGDYPRALEYCAKGVASAMRVEGPDSGNLAYAERDTGDALSGLRRYDEALASYAKAIAIHEKTGTTGEPNYWRALLGEGRAELGLGRAKAAAASLERAYALASKQEGASPEQQTAIADLEFALARALWETGARTARVDDLARDAAAIDDRLARADAARDVRSWSVGRRALVRR